MLSFAAILGVFLRYGIHHLIPSTLFPVATLLVNALGSFGAGVIFALKDRINLLHPSLADILLIAFLGAFTTFSALSLDFLKLALSGKVVLGLGYLFISLLLGVLFVFLGYILFRT